MSCFRAKCVNISKTVGYIKSYINTTVIGIAYAHSTDTKIDDLG